MILSCVVRDIVVFGPTLNQREFGLLLSGCRPPVNSFTDVGSAKKQREHPPVNTGLKIALHGFAGIIFLKLLQHYVQ